MKYQTDFACFFLLLSRYKEGGGGGGVIWGQHPNFYFYFKSDFDGVFFSLDSL